MKKQLLISLFLSLTLSSCYKVQKMNNHDLILSHDLSASLKQACGEIRAQGDIMKLMKEIKIETERALHLLENSDLVESEKKLRKLSESIEKKAYLVTSLAKKEWVTPIYDYTAVWAIEAKDLSDLSGSHFKKGLEFLDIQLKGISFSGVSRDDLLSNVNLFWEHDQLIKIEYKEKATALEMCQLNKSLMIIVDLKYRNIVNVNNRLFNLTLGNE